MNPSRVAGQCDDRKSLKDRLRRLDQQRLAARRAEEAIPLTVWYGPRPLRRVTVAELLEAGWWAA
jgi:hypothetical protein